MVQFKRLSRLGNVGRPRFVASCFHKHFIAQNGHDDGYFFLLNSQFLLHHSVRLIDDEMKTVVMKFPSKREGQPSLPAHNDGDENDEVFGTLLASK